MKELIIFSGLGADERVFQRLDFSGFRTMYIQWIVPQHEETIEHYTTRLLGQITATKPILIGLSFGGMMAMEVAKHMETEKVIVISSAKIYTEIPVYYRLAGRLRLHTLLPMRLLKSSNGITNWLFGAHSREEKQLLKQILLDTDPVFLKWAIDKIVRWTHSAPPRHTFHIHGTSDRILPLKYVACDVKIQNGGHLMILDKAEALTHILRQQCSEILLP